MANGKHHIQSQYPDGSWHTDLRMCMMGEAFAKGAFFALKSFNGGGLNYRLVRANNAWPVIPDGAPFEVLDTYSTGNIRVNKSPTT